MATLNKYTSFYRVHVFIRYAIPFIAGALAAFLYFHHPFTADLISSHFFGTALMVHLLISFVLKLNFDFQFIKNRNIEYITSYYVPLKARHSLSTSLFFLGFSLIISFYDTVPHTVISLFGSLYFFCFSVIISRPPARQQSAIYGLSLGVIIAMPFVQLDRLI